MNSPWFSEMLYDVLGRVKPGEMVYLAHALLHTHAFCYTPTAGVGREREEFGRKNVYVCKSSLEGGRGGLYEWWSWLGKKKKSSRARTCFDLNSRRIPIHRCCPARERARDGLLITIDFFFFLFPLLSSPFSVVFIHLRADLLLFIYIRIPTCINILHIYSARFSL